MLPLAPTSNVNRIVAAIGFIAEAREAGVKVDCSLTSRSQEDLHRLASSGDEDAFAELTRRRQPEPVAA